MHTSSGHSSGHFYSLECIWMRCIVTCIVDQDVKPLLSLEEVLAERSDRLQVRQVQLHVRHIQAVTPKLDLPHSFLCFLHISTCDDDTGTSHCQGNSCVLANTRIPT